jgi:hypothetical protein
MLFLSFRIAIETENIGAETLNTMGGQRKQLENTRDYVCLFFSFSSACLSFFLSLSSPSFIVG